MNAFDHINTVADLVAAIDHAQDECVKEVAELEAEVAWDAADELAPYRKTEGDNSMTGIVHTDPPHAAIGIGEAIEVLYAHRHTLPADVLRSLQSIYLCASAAQYGEPYEQGWLDVEDFRTYYGDHNAAECEAEDGELNSEGSTDQAHDATCPTLTAQYRAHNHQDQP